MLQSRLYFDTVVTRCHTWWVTQWYPSPLLSAYINYSSRTGYCYQFHLQCFLLELLYISECVLILRAESEITALIKHTACSYRVIHRVHCGFYSCFCGCAPDDETVSPSHVGVSSPLLRFFSFYFFCINTPWGVFPQTHTILYVPDVGRVLSLTQRHGSVLPSLPRDFELFCSSSQKKMVRVCMCVCVRQLAAVGVQLRFCQNPNRGAVTQRHNLFLWTSMWQAESLPRAQIVPRWHQRRPVVAQCTFNSHAACPAAGMPSECASGIVLFVGLQKKNCNVPECVIQNCRTL